MSDKQELRWERYSELVVFTVKHTDGDGTVTLPEKVNDRTLIAFSLIKAKSCRDIKKLVIPKTVERIKFIDCDVKNLLKVDKENKHLSTDGKALFNRDQTCLIRMFTRSINSYTIPETVQKIEAAAFFECSSLETIDIPEGLISIGKGSFKDCKSLQRIKLPNSLIEIGQDAFKNCDHLVEVNGGENVLTVVYSSFAETPWLNEADFVIIGSTLLTINKVDHELIIPKYVKIIDVPVFSKCKSPSIKKLVLPEAMEEIPAGVFDYCKKIQNIYIPASVRKISPDAFKGGHVYRHGKTVYYEMVSQLSLISVSENNAYYKECEGVLFTKDGKVLLAYPPAKEDREYTVPEGVEEIGAYAFWGNRNLEKIILPDSVRLIGKEAFACSSHLKSIDMGRSLRIIDDEAFEYCENLTVVNLPFSLEKISYRCFSYTGIHSIIIPESVKMIGSCAFDEALSDTVVELPKTVKKIGFRAFGKAKELIVPDDAEIQGLGEQQILITILDHSDGKIKFSVNMIMEKEPDKITTMMEESWNGTDFKFENLDNMFGDFKNIKDRINIALLRLEYPYKLSTDVEKKYRAFLKRNGHKIMKHLIDNSDIKMIEKLISFDTVSEKKGLELLDYANKKENTEVAAMILKVCKPGETKTVSSLALSDMIPELWDINKENTKLLGRYHGNESVVVFPTSYHNVDIIGTSDLRGKVPDNYSGITEVVIPEGYVSLGRNTFKDCINLTKVTLPSTLETIGEYCFANCKSIKEIILPKNVKKVLKGAFSGCGSLNNIILSSELKSLGDSTFERCYSLKTIDLGKNIVVLGSNCFTSTGLEKVIFRGNNCWCPEHMCFNYPRYVYTDGKIDALGIPASTHMPMNYIGLETDEIAKNANKNLLKDITVCACGSLKAFPKNTDPRFKCISFEDFVHAFGGIYKKLYSKKVDVVVTFKIDDNNSTIQKALANGTSVIEEREFLELLKKQDPFKISDYKPNKASVDKAKKKKASLKDDPYKPSLIKKAWGFTSNEDGTIKITDYKGNDTEIIVPERVGDCPVTDLDDSVFSPWKERRREDRKAFMNTIRKVSIPGSVKRLGKSVFSHCKNLINVSIPEGITEIAEYTFNGCTSLENIFLPKSIKAIKRDAFNECIEVKCIGIKAFSNCSNLNSVVIPEGVTNIKADAFCGCSSLTSVTIPDSVTSIEDGAFYGCNSLTNVIIPDSVMIIGAYAFCDCNNLLEITIPDSVEMIGTEAFLHCKNLVIKTIKDSYVEQYAMEEGIPVELIDE